MKRFTKIFAFTLAETLIVMGIIGVVAALTIPNLNSSTADKEKVAKVMKLYSNLQDAFGRATAVYGPMDEWFTGLTSNDTMANKIGERMVDFMKVTKTCGTSINKGCFSSKKNCPLVGTCATVSTDNQVGNPFYKVVTADGTSVAFLVSNSTCSQVSGQQSHICGYVYIDIDGPTKGMNTFGKDVFQFFIDSDMGIVPHGSEINSADTQEKLIAGLRSGSQSGWVVKNGNLDYLKIDATGKCPNGKVLNWSTNTSCK